MRRTNPAHIQSRFGTGSAMDISDSRRVRPRAACRDPVMVCPAFQSVSIIFLRPCVTALPDVRNGDVRDITMWFDSNA